MSFLGHHHTEEWKIKRKSYRHSNETKEKIRIALTGKRRPDVRLARLNDKNPMWKGNDVGLTGLHVWVKSRLIKPALCQCCLSSPPYDLANISQEYKRNLSDWEWLCRRCHMKKDGRFKNLKQFQKIREER